MSRTLTVSRKDFALALLCVAQFVVVLDVTIAAIALPGIQASLGFSQADLQWVVSAYTLVFGGFLMFAGRAAYLYGRRRLFAVGLVLFSVSEDKQGLASGLLNSSAQVSTALGPAVLIPLSASRTDILSVSGVPPEAALVAGFRWAFFGSTLIAILGALAAASLMGGRKR